MNSKTTEILLQYADFIPSLNNVNKDQLTKSIAKLCQ